MYNPGQEELIKILTEPKNALIEQYNQILSFDKTNFAFSTDSLALFAPQAFDKEE
jgi:ATP-dependent Clp protease ATP-binding subunit ClpX